VTGERKIKVEHASSAHFLDNLSPFALNRPGRHVYKGRRAVQKGFPRTLRHTPLTSAEHFPMNFRPSIPVNETENPSAESGRLMYDDAERENLNPAPAFRSVGGPVSNPYQSDSRFGANHLRGSLHDFGFPIPVFEHLGGNGTIRDATYPDTISSVLSGTRLDVSPRSSISSPSNVQVQGRKRPGRGGREQCESCRRQKNGIKVPRKK
jgi:hypothetical protein